MTDFHGPPSLGWLLLDRHAWFEEGLLALLHEAGWTEITRAQVHLGAFVDTQQGSRMSEVARRMGISRQAAHKTITELVAQGIVELSEDPTHRGAKLVKLAARGRRLEVDVRRALETLEQSLAERIGPRRLEELRRALAAEWGPAPRSPQ